MGKGGGGSGGGDRERAQHGQRTCVIQNKPVLAVDLQSQEVSCERAGIGSEEGSRGRGGRQRTVCHLQQSYGAGSSRSAVKPQSCSFSALQNGEDGSCGRG